MTARSWRRLALAAVTVVIVQVGILQQISIDAAHPDVFLLMAICAGLVAGPQTGAVIAFLWGLVADLFVVTPFGLSALCFVLVAFAVGQLSQVPGSRPPYRLSVVVSFAAGFVGSLLYVGLSFLVGLPHFPAPEIAVAALVVAVGCAVLAVPAMATTRWIFAGAAQQRGEYASVGTR